ARRLIGQRGPLRRLSYIRYYSDISVKQSLSTVAPPRRSSCTRQDGRPSLMLLNQQSEGDLNETNSRDRRAGGARLDERPSRRYLGCRRHVPVPDLLEMGRYV